MDMTGGTSINLHDAILERIEVLWQDKLCRCFVRAHHEGAPQLFCLEFSGVASMSVPHSEPWGPSSSILELTEARVGRVSREAA
jgi:hypothetical protein